MLIPNQTQVIGWLWSFWIWYNAEIFEFREPKSAGHTLLVFQPINAVHMVLITKIPERESAKIIINLLKFWWFCYIKINSSVYFIWLLYHIFCFAVTLFLPPVSDAQVPQLYNFSIDRTHLSTYIHYEYALLMFVSLGILFLSWLSWLIRTERERGSKRKLRYLIFSSHC